MCTRVDASRPGPLPHHPPVRSARHMNLAHLIRAAVPATSGAAHDVIGLAKAHRNVARLRAGERMRVWLTNAAP